MCGIDAETTPVVHWRMFPNEFAAHYIAENNKITTVLLLFTK
jgi:hypothetical protein